LLFNEMYGYVTIYIVKKLLYYNINKLTHYDRYIMIFLRNFGLRN